MSHSAVRMIYATLCLSLAAVGLVALRRDGVAQTPGRSSPEIERVATLYSEEDDLCQPLGQLYDELSRTRHYADLEGSRVVVGWAWEDEYPEKFSAIGLSRPAPIKDHDHPYYDPLGTAITSIDGAAVHVDLPMYASYEIDAGGTGTRQTVVFTDLSIGHNGAYGTTVRILRGGRDVLPGIASEYPGQFDELAPAARETFAFAFFAFGKPKQDSAGHFVGTPYFFNKIAPPDERRLSDRERQRMASSAPHLNAAIFPFIQRPFIFRDKLVVVARHEGLALVYKIDENFRISDICYFGDADAVRYLRSGK